jgi:hypothetical protein
MTEEPAPPGWRPLSEQPEQDRLERRRRLWGIVLFGTGGVSLVVVLIGMIAWAGTRADDWLAAGLHIEMGAREFGEQSTDEGCIQAALLRTDRCHQVAVGCMTASNLFAVYCLQEASPAPGTCAEVPDPVKVLTTARWQDRWCEASGRPGDQGCIAVARTLQDHCHGDS